MDEQKSKQNVSTASTNAVTTTTASSHTIHPRQRIAQNYLLIWIDASIDDSKQDCQNTLAQLRSVVNDVKIFTQRDEGIDFLTEVDDMKAFLILEGTLGSQIVHLIHDIPQLDGVYIFCDNKSSHEQWTKEWAKIKGVHTQIKPICEALQLAVKHCNQDSIAVSFVSTSEGPFNQNLEQLEPSFMYTQIFKEILLEMEHDKKAIKDLANYCRKFYNDNIPQLNIIQEFENTYQSKSPIWWYTRESFTYQMLNRALRTLEGDTIINMGFFMRDLHQQIQQLHQKQVSIYRGKSFIVYRGQGLLETDFEKLVKTKGGLMSFNNFLSTSKERAVSLSFAKSALKKTGMIGVLFIMTIDPSVSSAPFASIKEVSYYKKEEEILFSMHSVFRICDIKKIDKENSLYQVDLKLTADDDQELRILIERIREEVVGETGWQRLGKLLIKISQFNKAEELYNVLLEQAVNDGERALYYDHLGCIIKEQGDYEKAIEYFEKTLEIRQKTLPPNHPLLAISYHNIGSVYQNMGEYSKALSFDNKALEIFQETLPPNHPGLAQSYGNIGLVYKNMGDYSKGLLFYEKALEIDEKILPPNHPDLAQSYSKIGVVYQNVADYSKALFFSKKALQIYQKTLPPNHPRLAIPNNNIGEVYRIMGEYSKAHLFHEKALEIRQKTLPLDHPHLATSYNNNGLVYYQMGEYSKALSFHEKALEINEKTLPPNHPDLAISYNNIAVVYYDMGEHSKALSFHEKALEIRQKTLPSNHPHLAASYSHIGLQYKNMGEYSKALPFYEKALEINEKILVENHPDLATSYNDIGRMHRDMGEYAKALSFCEKALEIQQKALPPNHLDLAISYNNIGTVYDAMKEYSKSLSFYEKSLEILKKTLPSNHPDLAQSYGNIAGVYFGMEEYSKALSSFECTLNIYQSSLPPNHPNIRNTQRRIKIVKKKLSAIGESDDEDDSDAD